MKKAIAALLSLYLMLFLVDALVSLVDDSLIVLQGSNALTGLRSLLAALAFGMSLLVYLAMGVTPLVPKRFFLPAVLFGPIVALGFVPLAIYRWESMPRFAWLASLFQLLAAGWILMALRGRTPPRGVIVPEERLTGRTFSWWNTLTFAVVNLFVLVPAIGVYLALCSALAVDHLSGGFLVLRADGLSVRARSYVRDDGKSVQLVPMVHVGDPDFYRRVSASFPTNAVVLVEGVTDRRNLLKVKLSYERMASSLGLAEQRETFLPKTSQVRSADVDIEQFSPGTIDFLNLVARIHAEGLTWETVRELMRKSQDLTWNENLWKDLLDLRNAHLVRQLESTLREADRIVVPWGAAHMRGIAQEIQAAGFRPTQHEEYQVMHFRTIGARWFR